MLELDFTFVSFFAAFENVIPMVFQHFGAAFLDGCGLG